MKNYQQLLFPYAYNVLGSAEDARDVIQDVLVKHLSFQQESIQNIQGYLVKAVINQSINLKKRNQKLTSDSVWLPEPISTETADTNLKREEIASYSLLVLLEELNPTERAVFILKEAFGYSHQEIAQLLDSSIENSRKLLSRAKKKLPTKQLVKPPVLSDHSLNYLARYLEALKNGEVEELEKMLTEDIALAADGGSEIKVIRELTIGKAATRKLLIYVFQTYQKQQDVQFGQINHQPALLFFEKGQLVNCQVFEIDGETVLNIYSILAPQKLQSVTGVTF